MAAYICHLITGSKKTIEKLRTEKAEIVEKYTRLEWKYHELLNKETSKIKTVVRYIKRPDGTSEKVIEKNEEKAKVIRERSDKLNVTSDEKTKTIEIKQVTTVDYSPYSLGVGKDIWSIQKQEYYIHGSVQLGKLPYEIYTEFEVPTFDTIIIGLKYRW